MFNDIAVSFARPITPHRPPHIKKHEAELKSLLWNCGVEDLWGFSHTDMILNTCREYGLYISAKVAHIRKPTMMNRRRFLEAVDRLRIFSRPYNNLVWELRKPSHDIDFLPVLVPKDWGSKSWSFEPVINFRRRRVYGDHYLTSQNEPSTGQYDLEMSSLDR